MKKLNVYIDSRCDKEGNGAFCIIGHDINSTFECSGIISDATTMGAELFSVVQALETIHKRFMVGRTVTITIDSSYVFKGITQWLANWESNGWKGSDNKPVKNIDLWQRLSSLVVLFNITWKLVPSKFDHPLFVYANNEVVQMLSELDGPAVVATESVENAVEETASVEAQEENGISEEEEML